MTSKKETLPLETRRNIRFATLSAVFGTLPQVMVNSSSIIIIFATLIGASEMVSVMSTALLDSAICLLMLPFAALSDRIGSRRQINLAVCIGACALSVSTCAAWVHQWAGIVLLGSLAVFAVAMSAYIAAWYPLVEQIVPLSERGLFFGRMRFSWQLLAAIYILASGWFIGHHATVGCLQIIIILTAIISLGRAFCINQIVLKPTERSPPMRLGSAIRNAIENKSLLKFSVYLFFLYAASNATIPLVLVFAKNHLLLTDSSVVVLSTVFMGGLIFGYLISGGLMQHYGTRKILLTAHLGFALLNLLLLTVHSAGIVGIVKLSVILTSYGILAACASTSMSSNLLVLASPNNKAVSIAFGNSLLSAGLGGSRACASLLLGSGILVKQWQIGPVVFTRYHSLFLANAAGVLLVMTVLIFIPAVTRHVKRSPSSC